MILKIANWLFLLLVLSIPLVRPFYFQAFGSAVPATDVIFLACFAFWVLALALREAEIRFSKLYLLLGIYVLALVISAIFSEDRGRSFIKLAGITYLVMLAVLAYNLSAERTFARKIVLVWLAGTIVTVAASLAGLVLFYAGYKTQTDNYFLSHFGSLPAGDYPRIRALFLNANMMCNFLNVSIIFALAAERMGWIRKLASRSLQAGIWIAAIFTFSPGLGGMILSTGVWYWATLRYEGHLFRSRLSLAVGVLGACFFFAAATISPDTANTDHQITIPGMNVTMEPAGRVLVWCDAFGKFLDNPVTGVGVGLNAAELPYSTLSGQNQVLLDAHNVWLSVAAQAGLIGLAALILWVVYLYGKSRFALVDRNENGYTILACSNAFLGAFLYQGLTGSFEDARHLWILFGLLVSAAAASDAPSSLTGDDATSKTGI